MIYYIDNPDKVHRDFLPEGIECMSPADYLAKERDETDELVVLCEIDVDSNKDYVNRTDFYGISYIQELRRNNYKNKVLFVSFLPEEYFGTHVLNAKIMFFQGHGFLRLPTNPVQWSAELSKITELDSLSLYDCIHHFCGLKEIIDEALHKFKPSILGADSVNNIFNEFGEELKSIYQQLDKINEYNLLTTHDFDNVDQLYDSLEASLYSIVESSELSKSVNNDIIPKYKWSILWLDDVAKDQEMLSKELESRGVTVHTEPSVDNALMKFNVDQQTTKSISYIISDYRIEPSKRSYDKQGYQFLKEIAEKNSAIGLMAYSGLRRRFLFESFEHYGLQVYIHSKLDFLPNKVEDVKYLADIICAYGDKHYKLVNNAPQGAEWTKMMHSYLAYKSSLNFAKHQLEIDKMAKATLSDFKEKYQPISSEDELWNIRLDNPYPIPKNGWDRIKTDGKKEERIKDTMLSRRSIIAIYVYLQNAELNYLESKNIVHYLKYIFRCTQSSKHELSQGSKVLDIIRHVKTDRTFNQLSTFLALSLDEDVWPLGLLPEEYLWIKKEPSLGSDLESFIEDFWKDLRYANEQIREILKINEFTSLLKKEDNIRYLNATILKINAEGKKRQVTKKFFVDKDFYPHIKTLGEVKHALEYLKNQLIRFDHPYSDSTLFTDSLENLAKRNWSSSFSSLRTFIYNLPSPVGFIDFFTWYRETYTPWWFYRPAVKNWGRIEAQKELEFREKLFLEACTEENRTELFHGRKNQYDGSYPDKVVEKLESICKLIYDSYKDIEDENDWIRKRKTILHGIKKFKADRNRVRSKGKELFGNEASEVTISIKGYDYINYYNAKELTSDAYKYFDEVTYHFIGPTENEEDVHVISNGSDRANKIRELVPIDESFEMLLLYSFKSSVGSFIDAKSGITIITSDRDFTVIGIPKTEKIEFFIKEEFK